MLKLLQYCNYIIIVMQIKLIMLLSIESQEKLKTMVMQNVGGRDNI